MEDCNMLVADGIVICSCCPCMILQIIVFVFLQIPYRLAKKSKKVIHRKFCKKKRKWNEETAYQGGSQIEIEAELMRILLHGVSLTPHHDCQNTFDEIEKALDEFSQQGEFAFGSFWGRQEESNGFPPKITGQEEFNTVLHYQFIEMIKMT
ncbi:hypothetical protein ACHQM5_006883 [Ranunculus cassubicifolius]